MTYKLLKINLLVFIVLIISLYSEAQNSLLFIDEDLNYKKGVELFEKERYSQAQHFFNQAVNLFCF